MQLSAELSAKRDKLLAILEGLPSVAVAFSGGIDSTVVAKAAALALGPTALAVTADSPSVPAFVNWPHARQTRLSRSESDMLSWKLTNSKTKTT